MIAFSDASHRPGLGLAGLGVILDGEPISRVARAVTTQHAELLAAGLAVARAAPGPLALHTDCRHTALALQEPDRALRRWQALAQEIVDHARERQVRLTTVPVSREQNTLADRLAARALEAAVRRGVHPPRPLPTVRVRVGVTVASIKGVGLHATASHAAPTLALAALCALAGQVPDGAVLRVVGLPDYSAHLWNTPEDAPPTVRAARDQLAGRGARLIVPRPGVRKVA